MSRKRSPAPVQSEVPHEVVRAQLEAAGIVTRTRTEFALGQRWASEMEPELGLGTVTGTEHRRITLSFQNGTCVRQYAVSAAPLKRVRFRAGDTIQGREGAPLTVREVREKNGVLVYETDQGELAESDLSDQLRFTAPLDRLLAGDTDSLDQFRLRLKTLGLRARIDRCPVRGFAGARIELIPHQLYIAQEVSSRYVRRILLADEVGLGKTIEACLILHRLLASGRARRALILVPESLVHIWFVELIRKFNLLFRIFDREYFEFLDERQDENNPFLNEQLILTCPDYFAHDERLRQLCIDSGWDILIVDEAHHVREGTRDFTLLDALAAGSRDVLLLTATPSQFGERNHFARLRLLDPSRYRDFDAFVREAEGHRRIAQITARLMEDTALSSHDIDSLRSVFGDAGEVLDAHMADLETDPRTARREIVAELLDRHGIGRALFRNTRASVGGFPPRIVHRAPLDASPPQRKRVAGEFLADLENTSPADLDMSEDPRIGFVAQLLRALPAEKVLLICRTKEKVAAIEQALRKEINVNAALFHEELSLIQRDRNAAYFAEKEGARILLCSEIGSEGRNFQFAHHVVLFDLPANPELIEQRIGRLDRIGQKNPVEIHVPYVRGTPHEVLARWHDEGVDVFSHNAPAAPEVFDALGRELIALAKRASSPQTAAWKRSLGALVAKTRTLTSDITDRLAIGRDRLLEQHSFRPREAGLIADSIRETDRDESVDSFMVDLFKSVGIVVEQFGPRTYKLWSEASLDETFPGLRGSRPVVTFDRTTALHREDQEFMSIDHPSVIGGIDILVGSQRGNCCLAQGKWGGEALLLMEAVFVVEAVAPPQLNAGRFLPPTPVRVILDHRLRERVDRYEKDDEAHLQPWDGTPVLERPDVKMKLLPQMEKRAAQLASKAAGEVLGKALEELGRSRGGEVQRLKALRSVNPSVSAEEINRAQEEWDRLADIIGQATPRLDAIRLIWLPRGGLPGSSET